MGKSLPLVGQNCNKLFTGNDSGVQTVNYQPLNTKEKKGRRGLSSFGSENNYLAHLTP